MRWVHGYIVIICVNFGNYQCDDNYRLEVVVLNSELNDQRPRIYCPAPLISLQADIHIYTHIYTYIHIDILVRGTF